MRTHFNWVWWVVISVPASPSLISSSSFFHISGGWVVLWTGTIRMGEGRFMQKTRRDTERRMNFSAVWPGSARLHTHAVPWCWFQSCTLTLTVGCGHVKKKKKSRNTWFPKWYVAALIHVCLFWVFAVSHELLMFWETCFYFSDARVWW